MNLLINTNPRQDRYSLNITLAKRLALALGGQMKMIRLYNSKQEYFNYKFNQKWIHLVKEAKVLIFPVPMWNLSIPAALKDFFDKIVKKGELWDLDSNNRFQGLLKDTTAFIIMTSGDYYPAGHPQDFVIPYLRTLLNSLGIKDIKDFRIGGVKGNSELVSDKAFLEAKSHEMFEAFGL